MQLKAAELAISSLQQAVTTAPELYSLPKQMQQLLKVNSLLIELMNYWHPRAAVRGAVSVFSGLNGSRQYEASE